MSEIKFTQVIFRVMVRVSRSTTITDLIVTRDVLGIAELLVKLKSI